MLKSKYFTFDGISSETYGVMICFLDDSPTRELGLGTNIEVIEDRLPNRTKPINYGVNVNTAMTFPLSFGSTEYLSDNDVDAILSWLTGHQEYKWLEFIDGDHYVRYKCHLNNMQSAYINGFPVAFTCDVECDGQFAYEYPTSTAYDVDENEQVVGFYNKSSNNGYLYPKLELQFADDCNTLSIINETDNNREFKINYFDREVTEVNGNEQTYTTSLAEELSGATSGEEFISWDVKTFPIALSATEIIYGERNGVKSLVALPMNGDIALYSLDNGLTWNETTLPYSGHWIGCHGDYGFAAILIGAEDSRSAWSPDGVSWTDGGTLHTEQRWTNIKYIHTAAGFANGYYIAFAKNSQFIAKSISGAGWVSDLLPASYDWVDIIEGANNAILVANGVNIAYSTKNLNTWSQVDLPIGDSWSTGCHDGENFIVISDSSNGIALKSIDGLTWDIVSVPNGAWGTIIHNSSGYLLTGGNKFVYSLDFNTWKNGTLPYPTVSSTDIDNGSYMCALSSGNKYAVSVPNRSIEGIFNIDLPLSKDGATITNIIVSAKVDNTEGDSSYISRDEPIILASALTGADNTPVVTGGTFIAVTQDNRYDSPVDGVMLKANIDSSTNIVTITYVIDNTVNNEAVFNAPLNITINYDVELVTSLNFDGLVVSVDNENQIITSNKELINMYTYFNRKFFRLVKGMNKLKFKTDAGSCRVIMNYEFLRKVGGR